MEESAKPVPVLETEDNPHIFNKILKVVAYPVAAISGLWVAGREVHNGVYQKASSVEGNPIFGDIRSQFKPQYTKNAEEAVSGAISKEVFLANEFAIKTEHSRAIGERLEKIGFSNRNQGFGFKNFAAKWKYVNNGTKQSAIIQGLTVSGIAIGAMLTIANSKSIIDYFAKDKDKDEKTR